MSLIDLTGQRFGALIVVERRALAEACRRFGLNRKATHERLKREYGDAEWYLDREITRVRKEQG